LKGSGRERYQKQRENVTKASSHGDVTTAARERASSKGVPASRGALKCARNATNPRIGSGMQQARESTAAKPGEVVRNHEVGTRCARRDPRTRSRGGNAFVGVDAGDHVDGGGIYRIIVTDEPTAMSGRSRDPGESQERRPATLAGTQ